MTDKPPGDIGTDAEVARLRTALLHLIDATVTLTDPAYQDIRMRNREAALLAAAEALAEANAALYHTTAMEASHE